MRGVSKRSRKARYQAATIRQASASELPDAVRLIDATPTVTASRTAATTRSCVLGVDTGPSAARGSRGRPARSQAASLAPAEVAKGRLQMGRRHVVAVADLGLGQRGRNSLALGRTRRRRGGRRARRRRGQLDELAETQLCVPYGGLAALRVPAVEVLEEESQRGGQARPAANSCRRTRSRACRGNRGSRSIRTRSASSSSRHATRPPSPMPPRFSWDRS